MTPISLDDIDTRLVDLVHRRDDARHEGCHVAALVYAGQLDRLLDLRLAASRGAVTLTAADITV